MRTLNHIGIITTEKKEGAFLNEGLGVWLTDFSKSPNKIEYLLFEDNSCMPDIIKQNTHIAYEVASMEEELKGAKVLFGPVGDENLQIAFVEEEGIPIELMQFKK
jgi:hypothetical protein